MPERVQPPAVYDVLRHDILTGAFDAGSMLLETSLATRYGLSRTPVREALVRLEYDGLIERAGRGYRVRSGTAGDVLEIYEARIALEAAAAGAAATRHSELDLARLHRLHDLAAAERDPDQVRALNSEWHCVLWQAAGNATIESLLTRLTTQLRIYDRGTSETGEDLAATEAEHGAILRALADRDSETAGRLVAAHLGRARGLRLDRFVRSQYEQ